MRSRILAAAIVLLGTPIWLGSPSSVCRGVLERLDALLSETDDAGRMIAMNRVAGVVVNGNEDGAHNVIAQCYQGWPTWGSPSRPTLHPAGLARR